MSSPAKLSPITVETLELYRTMRRVGRAFGMQALGGNVMSMTEQASDLLNVLWLWKWSEQIDGGHPGDSQLRLPIIPLFETIADLRRAPKYWPLLLSTRVYREWVRARETSRS